MVIEETWFNRPNPEWWKIFYEKECQTYKCTIKSGRIVHCIYFVSFHLSSFQQIDERTKVWEWNARLDFCWSRNPIHPGRLVAAINISVAQRKYKCEGEKLKTWQQESWLRKSRIGTWQVECWFENMEKDAAWEMLQLRAWTLKVNVWELFEKVEFGRWKYAIWKLWLIHWPTGQLSSVIQHDEVQQCRNCVAYSWSLMPDSEYQSSNGTKCLVQVDGGWGLQMMGSTKGRGGRQTQIWPG